MVAWTTVETLEWRTQRAGVRITYGELWGEVRDPLGHGQAARITCLESLAFVLSPTFGSLATISLRAME